MAIDLYSIRSQLAQLEQMPREYSFLYDLFTSDKGTVMNDKAIYDVRKGTRKMAPMVHANTGGVIMERTGYETEEIGFCTIAPERVIERDNLMFRAFGENVFGAMTPAERAKKLQAQDLMEMRQAIQRRREWMARQVLLTGKLEIFEYTREGRDKYASKVADYGFSNNMTITNKWNAAGAVIEDDMKAMFDKVYDGGSYVDVVLMDPKAASAMLHNTDYIRLHDVKNVNIGEMNQRYVGQGVRYLGVNIDGVDMYSVSGTFVDDDGAVKPLLPAGTVIAGSKGMLNAYHGPINVVKGRDETSVWDTYVVKELAQRFGDSDSNIVKNRLTSRPTIVPENVDGWIVANVL